MIFRIVFGIIFFPLMLIAYLFKWFFYLFCGLAPDFIIIILACIVFVGGLIQMAIGCSTETSSDIWLGVGISFIGCAIYGVKYISLFLMNAMDWFIEWVQSVLFG